jgi:hypothetical protein
MAELKFCVQVSDHADTYGVTLYVDDDSESDVIPCYRSVFRGTAGQDTEKVSEMFAGCHKDAMDCVKLEGELSQEEYDEKMADSIELAGTLMTKYGFEALAFDDVGQNTLIVLFADDLPDGEESSPPLLN